MSLFGDHKPTDTLVGVAALSRADYMLEVDAIAVIDDGAAVGAGDRDQLALALSVGS